MLTIDAMRKELAAIKAQTTKPYNVNFFCHAPPSSSADHEGVWRATLSPYYKEYGINVKTILAAAARPSVSKPPMC
jgi:nitronate monooxygenase